MLSRAIEREELKREKKGTELHRALIATETAHGMLKAVVLPCAHNATGAEVVFSSACQ